MIKKYFLLFLILLNSCIEIENEISIKNLRIDYKIIFKDINDLIHIKKDDLYKNIIKNFSNSLKDVNLKMDGNTISFNKDFNTFKDMEKLDNLLSFKKEDDKYIIKIKEFILNNEEGFKKDLEDNIFRQFKYNLKIILPSKIKDSSIKEYIDKEEINFIGDFLELYQLNDVYFII